MITVRMRHAATWPFSFVVIGEPLDLEPEDIRAGLRAWRAAHASGVERGGRMDRDRLLTARRHGDFMRARHGARVHHDEGHRAGLAGERR